MRDALIKILEDARLLHREKAILAWLFVLDVPKTNEQICEGLHLEISGVIRTTKKLHELGLLSRSVEGMRFKYRVTK